VIFRQTAAAIAPRPCSPLSDLAIIRTEAPRAEIAIPPCSAFEILAKSDPLGHIWNCIEDHSEMGYSRLLGRESDSALCFIATLGNVAVATDAVLSASEPEMPPDEALE
jgi:hypothetical protein